MYNLKNKNVLVTGGAGFVGGHLVEELHQLKAKVTVVDIKLNKKSYLFAKKLNEHTEIVKLDLCNYKKLVALIKKNNIDFIFHLAAQALVEEAYKDPKHTLENNIVSTINVLEVARTSPRIKGVIVASSDKCYGKLIKQKYVETDPLAGDHPYDTSKSATDLICSTFYATYKTPVVITRFGNIYGEGDLNFTRIIPGIMKSLITKKPLEVRSNGKYIRDYLYVKDVVAGYVLLANNIEKSQGEAYNFGSNDNLSVLQVIQAIEKTLSSKIKYNILNTAKNEIPYQSLDYSKINSKFGWKPKQTVEKTALTIFNWYFQL